MGPPTVSPAADSWVMRYMTAENLPGLAETVGLFAQDLDKVISGDYPDVCWVAHGLGSWAASFDVPELRQLCFWAVHKRPPLEDADLDKVRRMRELTAAILEFINQRRAALS